MITIKENGCEFQYKVKTIEQKAMNELSPRAYELSNISADVHVLMACIDQKYGKCTALKMFGIVVAGMYTSEEIDQADKEINGNE